MKKIISILIISIFTLSSCSNPEDLERIEELEKQIINLENTISEIQLSVENNILTEKEYIFDKNKECGLLIDKMQIDRINEWWDNFKWINQIFYSEKVNSCIYEATLYFQDTKNQFRYLFNFFTKEEITSRAYNKLNYWNIIDNLKSNYGK